MEDQRLSNPCPKKGCYEGSKNTSPNSGKRALGICSGRGGRKSGHRALDRVRAMKSLVLSLFPGADLLGRGFEQAGFCVVRGPDLLLGQRIEDFHAPTCGHAPDRHAGSVTAFEGIIGGPPCQDFSRARRRPPTGHGLKMLGEFARVVTEFGPDWWLMENVPGVPSVKIEGYTVQRFNLFASDFGLAQRRNRAFQFGAKDGLPLVLRRTVSQLQKLAPAALAGDDRRLGDLCELQGLPRTFDLPGLSYSAKKRAIGNGVPLKMAAAVAEAIRVRRPVTFRLCICDCGRPVTGKQIAATPACRKRIERSRRPGHTSAASHHLVSHVVRLHSWTAHTADGHAIGGSL
jgi:DNA (cytosine-5)-methyltransferase 1